MIRLNHLSVHKNTPIPISNWDGRIPCLARRQSKNSSFQIPTVPSLTSVTMYYSHPRRLAKSPIAKQNLSHRVNDVCNGSPSRMRRVLLISFGMTILPRSSTRRTMPVAFIILFSFEAHDARFSPVEVFAGKGELCMGAAAIFFSGCVSFKAIPHRKRCQKPPSVI